jgi:DNA-binding transcriptional MerR regulator
MDQQIPDKLYFKIGEVADLTGIKPHVLRYWEAEIGSLRPVKNRQQQRLYRQRDIELVLRLKELLYSQGYTIAGALTRLRLTRGAPVAGRVPVAPAPPPTAQLAPAAPTESGQLTLPLQSGIDRVLLAEIRNDIVRLRNSLDSAP